MIANSPRAAFRSARLAMALLGALTSLAALAPAASAAQTIQVAATPSPTLDGVTTTVTVAGASDSGGTVYATLDPAGSTCAVNPSADNGSSVISGDSVGGPTYADSQTFTPAAGDYVLCSWLMPAGDDGSGTPLAGPASAPLSVQPLQGFLTISAPVRVADLQNIPVTVKWQADTAGSLFIDILPSSYGPCTADPSSEPQYVGWLTGQGGYTNNDPIGQDGASGTSQYIANEFAPDTYQLCAWVEESSGGVVVGPVALNVQMLPLPGSRTYSGRTSQGLPFKVTVTGYTVQDIVYSASFRCGASQYFSTGLRWNGIWKDNVLTAANFGTLRVLNDRLIARLDSNPVNRVDIRGRLSGSSLVGSMHAVMRIAPPQFRLPATCRTGDVKFFLSTLIARHRARSARHRARSRSEALRSNVRPIRRAAIMLRAFPLR